MSAALRPTIQLSPLPELRDAIERKLAQIIEIATVERMEDAPDQYKLSRLTGKQDAYCEILSDIKHLERRT